MHIHLFIYFIFRCSEDFLANFRETHELFASIVLLVSLQKPLLLLATHYYVFLAYLLLLVSLLLLTSVMFPLSLLLLLNVLVPAILLVSLLNVAVFSFVSSGGPTSDDIHDDAGIHTVFSVLLLLSFLLLLAFLLL
jgi:hypothetical protein